MKRPFWLFTCLNICLWAITTLGFVWFALQTYKGLPENHPLRVKLKLGRKLKLFDISPHFYQYKDSKIPIYDLSMKPEHYHKLIRNLPKGLLLTEEYKQYVPSKFHFQNKHYNVKVRFRGMSPNHWSEPKKSWRIKFKKKDLYKGKKSINLILPEDRAYLIEHLSNRIAKKWGLITPESRFVGLRINGKYQGLYFEIEQISGKNFLERHGKNKYSNLYNEQDWNWFDYGFTPIFSHIGHWEKKARAKVPSLDDYSEIQMLLKLLKDPGDANFFKKITSLIDMDQFLKWQAHSMLFGSDHQNNHVNVNLYFDISKGKFEPIPWDVHQWEFKNLFIDSPYNDLVTRILKNPKWRHQRNKILWHYVSDPKNLKDDLAFYDTTFQKIKSAYYADSLKGYSNRRLKREIQRHRTTLIHNREKIKKSLNFSKVFLSHYTDTSQTSKIITEITVQGMSAVRLAGIDVNGTSISIKLNRKPFRKNIILFDRRDGELQPVKATYRYVVEFSKPVDLKDVQFRFENDVTGATIISTKRIVVNSTFEKFDDIFLTLDEFVRKYPYFVVSNRRENEISLKHPYTLFKENMIIPKALTLYIKAGTTLAFQPGISLLSYGKVIAKGTAQKKIKITTSKKNTVRGTFALIGENASNSLFEYVVSEYGGESYVNGVSFTGGLSAHFVENVTFRYCEFQYNKGDDALNIKNGIGVVENSSFLHNVSDAIDFDFIKGKVQGCTFEKNEGDSIDLGNSSPILVDNIIQDCGDKGISIGEKSEPEIENTLIQNCHVGIAVKDQSRFSAKGLRLENNDLAIASYIKKEIYDAPRMSIIQNSLFSKNQNNFKIESGILEVKNSTVDGKKIENYHP